MTVWWGVNLTECQRCGFSRVIRWGTRKGKQIWRCQSCGKYFTFGEKRKTEEKIITPDYSLGYVIGVLMGDGSLSTWKDYHYFDDNFQQVRKAKATKIVLRFRYGFQLQVQDKDFAEEFAKHLSRISGRKVAPYEVSRPPVTEIAGNKLAEPYEFRGYKVQMTHKGLYQQIKPLLQNLTWMRPSNIEVKKGFLRGLFDSEGGVSLAVGVYTCRAHIHLTNTNVALLLLTKDLLKEFGINSYIQTMPKISRLWIKRKDDAEKFYRIIGFSINRKSKKIGDVYGS
jgi:hypothetical protein